MQNKKTPQFPQEPNHDDFGPIDSLRPIGEIAASLLQKIMEAKDENK